MDLGDLAIFQAVLQEGGITAAARRLNRVQSNITTRIRQLEDDLGVPLFQREVRVPRLQATGVSAEISRVEEAIPSPPRSDQGWTLRAALPGQGAQDTSEHPPEADDE